MVRSLAAPACMSGKTLTLSFPLFMHMLSMSAGGGVGYIVLLKLLVEHQSTVKYNSEVSW